MTYSEFRDAAWKDAPPLRKRIVGRVVFDGLVDAAVSQWDCCRVDARELLGRVRATHEKASGMTQQEYGFIWIFLLSAAASALIQWLIKRWLDRHFTADDVEAWRAEMTR